MPWQASVLAGLLLTGAITALCLWCQPNALRSVVAVLRAQPLLILLNALPVGLLLLTLSFLTGNVFYGAGLAALAAGLLSVVNRVKIEVRDEPLFPRDFALLKEL
ncbi:MAG: LTA synthase family protein, partial [Oscillibacter sp.]|nr:LTA synthase family protein [Oscillibacter sp.]